MKRIAIFGSYHGASIGDTAILLGLVVALQKIYARKIQIESLSAGALNLVNEFRLLEMEVFYRESLVFRSSRRHGIEQRIRQFVGMASDPAALLNHRAIVRALKHKDYLLIGGGQLIMDLFPQWPYLLKRVCDIARQQGVPYAFVGVGAGPINSNAARQLLGESLNHAHAVFCRDQHSMILCNSIMTSPRSQVAADLAFGLNEDHLRPPVDRTSSVVAVNVAAVFGPSWPESDLAKYRAYLQGMHDLTVKVVKQQKAIELIIYDTNCRSDTEAGDCFANGIDAAQVPVKITRIRGRTSVKDLLHLCGRAKIAISSRLHAGIIAHLAGCKLIAVAYQPKVRDVFQEYGITDAIINLDSLMENPLSPHALDRLIDQTLAKSGTVTCEQVSRGLVRCIEILDPRGS